MSNFVRKGSNTASQLVGQVQIHNITRAAISQHKRYSSSNVEINKYSKHITQPKSQGASQAMLYGTGLKPEDMSKAQVGISSVWYEGNPCNMHLLDLSAKVKEGVIKAGMVGYRFNTVGVSDGISMGTKGMSFSLQSRDLIADSIET
ncbi:9204_t:CDS:2, partial [Acaulospora morrowiae]